MNKIKDFLSTLLGSLLLIGPIRSIRMFRLGSQAVAAFRRAHGREPTEQECLEIARRVDKEIG